MPFRRAFVTLTLVAVTGAVTLVPTPALATVATLAVQNGTVTFTSPTNAIVTIDYTCGTAEEPTTEKLQVVARQHLNAQHYGSYAINEEYGTVVICDGTARSADQVALAVHPDSTEAFENGPGNVRLLITPDLDDPDVEDRVVIDVTVAGVPGPSVALVTNASPDTAHRGDKIKVKGTVTQDGAPLKKVKAKLLFAADGGDFVEVKTVKSDKKGKLSTKVKAKESGSWAYAYGGVTSAGVEVTVIPAPKAYKNCTALNAVYPNGVGKKGAVDQGGSVDNFTVDNATYAKNKKSDRDKDGIACEQ